MKFTFGVTLVVAMFSVFAHAQSLSVGGREGELDVRGRLTVQGDKGLLNANKEQLDDQQSTYDTLAPRVSDVVNCNAQRMIKDVENGGCKAVSDALPSVLNKSDIALWLDASADLSLKVSSGKVREWQDKSGNNHVFSQSTASARPVFDEYSKMVDFTASDVTYLTSPTTLASDDYTIFMVAKPRDFSGHQTYFTFKQGGAEHPLGSVDSTGRVFFRKDSSVKYVNLPQAAFDVNSNQRNIMVLRPKEDVSKTLKIYNYEVPFVAGNLAGLSYPANNANGMRLGAGLTSQLSNTDLRGGLHEVIIYTRTLDDAEVTEIVNYLETKWAVTPPVSCAGSSINIIQCSTTSSGLLHNGSQALSCGGTYGSCAATVSCNDGVLSVSGKSCPPPANCTTTARTISSGGYSCSASTGSITHGQTANIGCNYAYGPCTGTVSCNNGTVSGVSSAYCTPPSNCSGATISNCTMGATNHLETKSGSCRSGYTGSCSYSCTDGSFTQVANACVPSGCSATTRTLTFNTGGYFPVTTTCDANTGTALNGTSKTIECDATHTSSSVYTGPTTSGPKMRGTVNCSNQVFSEATNQQLVTCPAPRTFNLGACTASSSGPSAGVYYTVGNTYTFSCDYGSRKYSGKVDCRDNETWGGVYSVSYTTYAKCAATTNITLSDNNVWFRKNYTFTSLDLAFHDGQRTSSCSYTYNYSTTNYTNCVATCKDGTWKFVSASN